jgi:hypothetical protein
MRRYVNAGLILNIEPARHVYLANRLQIVTGWNIPLVNCIHGDNGIVVIRNSIMIFILPLHIKTQMTYALTAIAGNQKIKKKHHDRTRIHRR